MFPKPIFRSHGEFKTGVKQVSHSLLNYFCLSRDVCFNLGDILSVVKLSFLSVNLIGISHAMARRVVFPVEFSI